LLHAGSDYCFLFFIPVVPCTYANGFSGAVWLPVPGCCRRGGGGDSVQYSAVFGMCEQADGTAREDHQQGEVGEELGVV